MALKINFFRLAKKINVKVEYIQAKFEILGAQISIHQLSRFPFCDGEIL